MVSKKSRFIAFLLIGIGITVGFAFAGSYLKPSNDSSEVIPATFALFGILLTTILVVINNQFDFSEKKDEIEWLSGMGEAIDRARKMRRGVHSCIKGVWCLEYKDKPALLTYLNEETNESKSIERIINTKKVPRNLVENHLKALKTKLADGTYQVSSTSLDDYEFYLVDGDAGLILLPHGVTKEDVSGGIFSKNDHFRAWLQKVFKTEYERGIELALSSQYQNSLKIKVNPSDPEKSIKEWLDRCYGTSTQ